MEGEGVCVCGFIGTVQSAFDDSVKGRFSM